MNNLKTKVDDLNVGKFSVDLKKVTDVADNEVVKNTKLNTLKTKVNSLRCYATFKKRKFESLFYKINTCLRKNTTCTGLRAKQIFSVTI